MAQRPYQYSPSPGSGRCARHCVCGVCAFTGTRGPVERFSVQSGAAAAELRTDIGIAAETRPAFHHCAAAHADHSPWSSKASDIFTRCGLDGVLRVERGVRWFAAEEGADLSVIDLEALHDRMTEQCWSDESFEDWFAQATQACGLSAAAQEGMAALHEANARLGLALSEDEFEYLQDAYQTLQRDHRRRADDVAQANSGIAGTKFSTLTGLSTNSLRRCNCLA